MTTPKEDGFFMPAEWHPHTATWMAWPGLEEAYIRSHVAGPGSTTLPLVIYSKVKLGVSPDINALATIIIAIVTVGVIIAGWLINKKEKAYKRDIQMAIAANE
jgi:putrescine transport system permease protein